jgi:DNA topoisomerase-3
VRKEKKNLIATPTGMELIGTIQEELLKSAELTGLWEKKLRQIEKGTYEARTFLEELKQLVYKIVSNVFSDTSARTITIQEAVEEKSAAEKGKKKTKSKPKEKPVKEETAPAETKPICPMCRKGSILRGKTAYGCSEYKNGCSFRLDYATYGEGLSDAQLIDILNKR